MIPAIGLGIVGTAYVYFYTPESPRWLITYRKYDKAREVFNIIALRNGVGIEIGSTLVFVSEKREDFVKDVIGEENFEETV